MAKRKGINLLEDVMTAKSSLDIEFEQKLELFKNRELKAKDIFELKEVTKMQAYEFIRNYHYLEDAKFFCEQAFAIFYKGSDKMVGCATFSLPQGTMAMKGWFGLTNQDKCIYELSRLCLLPILNKTNATSYLLGGSIKQLKKQGKIKAVITLADSSRHAGSIYQVCNFKYYGLTSNAMDFYTPDGKCNPRGKTEGVRGLWLHRTKKHRYAYIIDTNLKCLYEEKQRPTIDDLHQTDCCNGLKRCWDNRFNEWWTCPRCTGMLKFLGKGDENGNFIE